MWSTFDFQPFDEFYDETQGWDDVVPCTPPLRVPPAERPAPSEPVGNNAAAAENEDQPEEKEEEDQPEGTETKRPRLE